MLNRLWKKVTSFWKTPNPTRTLFSFNISVHRIFEYWKIWRSEMLKEKNPMFKSYSAFFLIPAFFRRLILTCKNVHVVPRVIKEKSKYKAWYMNRVKTCAKQGNRYSIYSRLCGTQRKLIKSTRNFPFPIDLEPNWRPFGSKSIGAW